MAPSHYLNHCWNIVNWTLGKKLHWNFNRNSNIFIQEIVFKNVVCKMASILSRPQWVNAEQYLQSKIDQTWCRSSHKFVHLVRHLCVIETGKIFIVLGKMYFLNISKAGFHSLFEIYMHLLAIHVMMAFPRNTSRPRHNVIFRWVFLNENIRISINISLKIIARGPINNNPALVQIMAWCQPGDKPLS